MSTNFDENFCLKPNKIHLDTLSNNAKILRTPCTSQMYPTHQTLSTQKTRSRTRRTQIHSRDHCPPLNQHPPLLGNSNTVTLILRQNHPPLTSKSPNSQAGNEKNLRPWSSWTANSDKKLNVKPCVTSLKTAFRKFCKIFCQFSRCHKFW